MNTRITYPAAALALAAGVPVAVLAAGSAPADAGTAGTLHLVEKIVSFTEVDVRPRGVSQGDSFVYRSDLLDPGGDKVGRGGGECVSLRPAGGGLGLTGCDSVLELDGGQLAYTGFFDFSGARGSMPVIGGTGRYRNAAGQLDWVAEGGRYRLTVHLAR